jgi:hypothetical protein
MLYEIRLGLGIALRALSQMAAHNLIRDMHFEK